MDGGTRERESPSGQRDCTRKKKVRSGVASLGGGEGPIKDYFVEQTGSQRQRTQEGPARNLRTSCFLTVIKLILETSGSSLST